MEISDTSASRAPRSAEPTSLPARRRAAAEPAETAATDRIEVSAEARSLVTADELTRARRVAQLRASVDAGTYSVDPAALARRLAERGDA